jgi:hypothetical protein
MPSKLRRLSTAARLRMIGIALLALAGTGCSYAAISDRYGNRYGDWSDPGMNFHWQLQVCDREVALSSLPQEERKDAMRCCMRDRDVPVEEPLQCRPASG